MTTPHTSFAPRELAAALLVVVIWGLNFVVTKVTLREFTPFQLGTFRYLFAALPLVLVLPRPPLRWRWLLAAGLAQLAQFAMVFVAIRMGMSAALASVLLQTQVFFTALLGLLLLREPLRGAARAALALAAAGLACFGIEFAGGAGGGITLASLVLILGAATMWAVSNIIVRRIQASQPRYDALPFMVWISLVPILPFAGLAWLFDPEATRWQWLHASATGWAGVAYLGWCATLAGYALWTWLLQRHPANRVAPFSLGVPVIGLATGMLVLGETITPWQWAGSACIVAALLVGMLGPRLFVRAEDSGPG
ncbi:EamA family transporter [Xylophilus rhododendri]|uniref:EamA family transporter n=1 Tax=Xylophilus rhododendri TaxID=2697032 RepID=A0A857J3Q6_9BURK|nr:EamA family transporter [Xylophilus rhododendri]QHI98564.1 EamA family transporter [Xylophilus rhododendri]